MNGLPLEVIRKMPIRKFLLSPVPVVDKDTPLTDVVKIFLNNPNVSVIAVKDDDDEEKED